MGKEPTNKSDAKSQIIAKYVLAYLLLALVSALPPLQIMAKIHWQAMKLWAKRLPVFRKAADKELQRDLYNPHHSLTQTKESKDEYAIH